MKTANRQFNQAMKDWWAKLVACFPLRPLTDPKYSSLWESKGVHITADYCYSPIPHLADLSEDIWKKESAMVGVDLNEAKQLELLRLFGSQFGKEFDGFRREKKDIRQPYEYYLFNPFYGPVDAETLYGMIRHFKPRKMIEVGSGFSTYLSAQAIAENRRQGFPGTELIAIECNPNETLKKGVPGLTKLVQQRIEEVPLRDFEDLQENDILLIDSSHTLRTGGDVQYIFLEILPRLNKKGVLIHVHDIFFPGDYPREWVVEHQRFWAEQYLLQAFLMFNEQYEVLWCGNFMHRRHPTELSREFRSYKPDAPLDYLPKSFWMRRK